MSTIVTYADVDHGLLERHSSWEPDGGTGVYRRRLYVWRNFGGRWTPCDLLIFLDGQNLFSTIQPEPLRSWKGEKHFSAWERPLLVVGIPASKRRYSEYVGWSSEPGHFSPSGERHADFLVQCVLPYIKAQFPRARVRGLIGASAGGVAALYTGWLYPKLFPSIACLSAGRHYFDELLEMFDGLPAPRLYLSCGNRGMDRGFLQQNKQFAHQLRKRRPKELLCRWHKGQHIEEVWSRRIPGLLKFTLGKLS